MTRDEHIKFLAPYLRAREKGGFGWRRDYDLAVSRRFQPGEPVNEAFVNGHYYALLDSLIELLDGGNTFGEIRSRAAEVK